MPNQSKWVKTPTTVPGDELAEETLQVKVATLAATGQTVAQIARATGLEFKRVQRILNTDECKAVLRSIGDDAYAIAVAQLKQECRKRVQKAFAVLDKHLEKGNLNAAIQVFKMVDKEQQADTAKGDTVIHVEMPREINITPEDKPKTIEGQCVEVDDGKDS